MYLKCTYCAQNYPRRQHAYSVYSFPAKIASCHDVTFSRLATLLAMPFHFYFWFGLLFISYCGTVHCIPEIPQPFQKLVYPDLLHENGQCHFLFNRNLIDIFRLQTINKHKSMPEERLSFPPVIPKLKLVLLVLRISYIKY